MGKLSQMKTPIAYYGGKQRMVKNILPLIPPHKIYIEPFFGGGAIFWAKKRSKVEVINDVNMNVVNFYEVLKHAYFDLKKKVEATLHSRETYKKAMIIYHCPWLFADDPVIRAWSFFVVTNQGFSNQIGSWGYDSINQKTKCFQNKIDAFTEELSYRLKYTQIEQNEARKVIASRDSEETFVYADPPYIDTNQAHYSGYTESHYRRDLDALASAQGKFLLSSYPSNLLNEFIEKHGWKTIEIDKPLTAGNGSKITKRKRKIEVLTANYEI